MHKRMRCTPEASQPQKRWNRSRDSRAFLQAAAKGDIEYVDKYIVERGNVNVAYGEGWTALHYAVWHGHISVLQRLVDDDHINLNLCTLAGTSALRMALQRQSARMVNILLQAGASRALIGSSTLELAQHSSWFSPCLRYMLTEHWSIVWSPNSHRHFPHSERYKCQLILWANVASQRRCAYIIQQGQKKWQGLSLYLTALLDTLRYAFVRSYFSLPIIHPFQTRMSTIRAIQLTKVSGLPHSCVYWMFLPWPVVYLILEFAIFLW